jgi:PPOX class probable F420-dependent enzyme
MVPTMVTAPAGNVKVRLAGAGCYPGTGKSLLGIVSRVRLTEGEARERFGRGRVARLATADASGAPHLVPFTFALDGDLIVLAVDHKPKSSRPLRRITNITDNPQVSALVDHYEEQWPSLWWARADGRGEIWDDPERCRAPIALLQAKYGQYRERPPQGPVVAIVVSRWSGWSYSE